jgi:glycine dehydrogenase subunit 2
VHHTHHDDLDDPDRWAVTWRAYQRKYFGAGATDAAVASGGPGAAGATDPAGAPGTTDAGAVDRDSPAGEAAA